LGLAGRGLFTNPLLKIENTKNNEPKLGMQIPHEVIMNFMLKLVAAFQTHFISKVGEKESKQTVFSSESGPS